LKRTAQFTAQSSGTGMVPPQQIKMLVPKKTKLFMEQTLRERENAVGKSWIFNSDI
jgi:Bardet-Biedl syndrome 1 protein